MKKDLNKLRVQIDEINNEILELLKKRFEVVKEIGKIKRENSSPIEVKEREEEIFKYLISNRGNIPKNSIIAIFKTIIEESKKYE